MDRDKKLSVVGAALDWPRQQRHFRADGSRRRLCVLDTTVEHWRRALPFLLDRRGAHLELRWVPDRVDDLFAGTDRHQLSIPLGDMLLTSRLSTPTEIELAFTPTDVTASSLHDLLELVVDLGTRTQKPVVITSEQRTAPPIVRYEPSAQRLYWC